MEQYLTHPESPLRLYRKRPVTIEAMQLGWETWSAVCNFVDQASFIGGVYLDDVTFEVLPEPQTSNTLGLLLRTLEGTHLARQGDYIIKGVKGEFYPCKPDIFALTYESVDAEIVTKTTTGLQKE